MGSRRKPYSPEIPAPSKREREVIRLVALGLSSKEIASRLFLSVKTVETHRGNIGRKLDLHSVRDVILYALRNNMIGLNDEVAA